MSDTLDWKGLEPRIVIPANGQHAQRITDQDSSALVPGLELRQSHNGPQPLGVEADGTGALADVPLKATIADMGSHQSVSDIQGVATIGLGHGEEGSQLDLPQFLEGFLNGGGFFVSPAVAAADARKVLGHGCHASLTPLVHPPDVGTTQFAHPVGVTSESASSQITPECRTWLVENIEGGAQQHIDAQGCQFPPHDSTDLTGMLRVPGCAEGHVIGNRGHTAADLGVGETIAFMLNGDKEGDENTWRIRSLTGNKSQALQAIGEVRHALWRPVVIGEVLVGRREDDPAQFELSDKLSDIRFQSNIAAREGDEEHLSHLFLDCHGLDELADRVSWLLSVEGQRRKREK